MECISQRIPDFDYEPRELTPDEEREAEIGQLSDSAHMAKRKGSALRRLLAGEPLDFVGVPTDMTLLEWLMKGFYEEAARAELRIAELEDEEEVRREALRGEMDKLEEAIALHYRNIGELTRRQAAVVSELTALYCDQEVA